MEGRIVYQATLRLDGGPRVHPDERMSDDLVSVLWTTSLVDAEIAKGRLEGESIPVQLRGSN
jgi:hypothetical protein